MGISFCDVSDRLLFLDVPADRYFCLGDQAERGFRALIGRRVVDEREQQALQGLLRTGLLEEVRENSAPTPFKLPWPATVSLLEGDRSNVPGSELAAALSTLLSTRLKLRWGTLDSILRALAAVKAASRPSSIAAPGRLSAVSSAFEWSGRFIGAHDQCLSRSIAATRRLAALGLPGELVIGVRLRPFAAHSWVQAGDILVNDTLENVRTYTPILSI